MVIIPIIAIFSSMLVWKQISNIMSITLMMKSLITANFLLKSISPAIQVMMLMKEDNRLEMCSKISRQFSSFNQMMLACFLIMMESLISILEYILECYSKIFRRGQNQFVSFCECTSAQNLIMVHFISLITRTDGIFQVYVFILNLVRYTNTHLHKYTKMCICYFESRQVHKNTFLCICVNVFLGLLQYIYLRHQSPTLNAQRSRAYIRATVGQGQ